MKKKMEEDIQNALNDPFLRREVIDKMVFLKKKRRLMNLKGDIHVTKETVDDHQFDGIVLANAAHVPLRNEYLYQNTMMRSKRARAVS
jgi:hypothetical protein